VSGSQRIRVQRILREAHGYLELEMPQHALSALVRIQEPGTFKGQVLFLTGEALRGLGRFHEALRPLEAAADLMPSNTDVWVALGWCQKRSGRLDLAITALEKAQEVAPNQALIHYNLACYWSLARNKRRALDYLSTAFGLDAHYRQLVDQETDFDPLRADPDFQALLSVNV